MCDIHTPVMNCPLYEAALRGADPSPKQISKSGNVVLNAVLVLDGFRGQRHAPAALSPREEFQVPIE